MCRKEVVQRERKPRKPLSVLKRRVNEKCLDEMRVGS